MLRRLVDENPSGRAGDEAALVLGNLLIGQQQNLDAVPPLERAEKGGVAPEYASLLLLKAVVEGGLSDKYDAAEVRGRAFESGERPSSPSVKEQASYLLARLYSAQKLWPRAVASADHFLSLWPKSKHADEVRWIAASGRRGMKQPEAYDAFERIWYESPGSPWAKDAHQIVVEMQSSEGRVPRALSPDERYEFIRQLRRAGLHRDALAETDTYMSQPGAGKKDAAMFLRAASLFATFKRNECIAAAEELRRSYPRSRHAAAAGLQAIRALRGHGNTSGVRQWAAWITQGFPGTPEAVEAQYHLGTYLITVNEADEGLQVLQSLVKEAPKDGNAEDALWKVAWAHRQAGRTQEAVGALRLLLASYPETGFRAPALYWVGRFGADQDRNGSVEAYQALVMEFPHDYYGHQAAANLAAFGVTLGQVGNGRAFPSVDRLDSPDARPDEAYALAANLKRTGLFEFAATELLRVPGIERDRSLQFALAELYSLAGDTWEAQAILGKHFKEFVRAGSRDARLVPKDFWYAVYPYNYREIVRKAVVESGIDRSRIEPALVASLIRMESRFKATAISPVGAIGLMQLMPDTATQIAKEIGAPPPSRSDLFDPQVNIRYGVRYLQKRVEEFGGDWFPAICSYNAGVGPVREWWTKKPIDQPQDEFIETIPYIDTRLYIKRILGDYQNYLWIYKQN